VPEKSDSYKTKEFREQIPILGLGISVPVQHKNQLTMEAP